MGNWCAGVTSAARRRRQRVGPQAAVVHVDGDELEPGALKDRAVLPEARLLDEHAARAAGAQEPCEQGDRLGDAGGDDDVVGGGDHAARATEVGGEDRPQPRRARPRAVAEVGVGRGGQRAAHRGQPRAAREGAALGRLRAQVEAHGGNARDGRSRRRPDGRRHLRHARGRAAARHEEALGDELPVGLHHHPARDAELGRQRARRRQGGAGVQAPVAHAVAQLLLELDAQRRAVLAVEDDEEVAAEVVHSIHGEAAPRTGPP